MARPTTTGRSTSRATVTTRPRADTALAIATTVLVASPAVFNPAGYEQYQLPHLMMQGLAVVAALAAMLVGRGVAWSRAFTPIAALLAAFTLSALVSDSPSVALLGTSGRRFGVVGWLVLAAAFVVGSGSNDRAGRIRLIRATAVASAVVSTYALVQRLGLDPFAVDGAGPSLRPGSTLGGATYLGGYLACATVLCAGAAMFRSPGWRWIAPITVIDAIALVITQSRGAWVGLVGGGVLLAAAALRRATDRRAGLIALGGVAAAAVATLALVPGLVDRAATLTRPTEGTAGARLDMAEIGLAAIIDRPILGWGPDLSRAALHDHLSADFEPTHQDQRIEDRVHNVVLDVAVWGGLLGAGCLIWFVVVLVRTGWRRRHDDDSLPIIASLAAFGLHLWFNFPTSDVDVIAWVLAGSLAETTARRLRVPSFMVVVPATAFCGLVLVTSANSMTADRQLRIGVDRENAGDVAGAGTAYRQAVIDDPDSALLREVLARYLLRVQDPAGAAEQAAAGIERDPTDPYLRELWASALTSTTLNGGDSSAAAVAATELTDLIDRSPYDGSLHLGLGNALAAQGDLDAAEDEYYAAIDLIPKRSEPYRNLGLLAEQRGDTEFANAMFLWALRVDPTDTAAQQGAERTK